MQDRRSRHGAGGFFVMAGEVRGPVEGRNARDWENVEPGRGAGARGTRHRGHGARDPRGGPPGCGGKCIAPGCRRRVYCAWMRAERALRPGAVERVALGCRGPRRPCGAEVPTARGDQRPGRPRHGPGEGRVSRRRRAWRSGPRRWSHRRPASFHPSRRCRCRNPSGPPASGRPSARCRRPVPA